MKKANLLVRRVLACLCIAALTVSLSACSQIGDIVSGVTNTVNAGEFPVEINGTTVSARPQKAVVMSGWLADVVLALGNETQLAAITDDCTQENLSTLPKVGGEDAQALIDLGADLVLGESFSDGFLSALSEAGITALTVSPANDREDFERLYSQVSSAFAGGGLGYDAGISTAQGIFTTMDDINRIVPKEKVTTACYLFDTNNRAVTGDMFGSTIMSYAGVTNVFNSLSGGTYDFESLRVSNPDAIFCVPGLKSQIENDSRFADFQAVQNNKVFELDETYMSWQGRTIITAAYEISGSCFPELLEETSQGVTDPTVDIDKTVSSQLSEPSSDVSSDPAASAPEDDTEYTTLQQGDQSEEVLKMQTRLDALGYIDTAYDGFYGEYTVGCVKDFQAANGLEETGIADAATQRVLYSSSAKEKTAE